jgi:hypothetical protein
MVQRRQREQSLFEVLLPMGSVPGSRTLSIARSPTLTPAQSPTPRRFSRAHGRRLRIDSSLRAAGAETHAGGA